LETGSDEAGSSDSDKDTDTSGGHDEDFAAANGSQVHIWSGPQDTWNSRGVHSFTGLRIQEAPHENLLLSSSSSCK